MIPFPNEKHIWLVAGHTDMRRGMKSLAIQAEVLRQGGIRHGDIFVFRGKSGANIKIIWHDGMGMSLYVKKLDRGRYVWPTPDKGQVAISSGQLGYMLEGIDWRNPVKTYQHEYYA